MNITREHIPDPMWVPSSAVIQKALDAIGQAAALLAPSGHFVAANLKLAELLGDDHSRLLGRTTEGEAWRVRDIEGKAFTKPLASPQQFFERSRSAISGVVEVSRADGSSTTVAARAVPVFGDAGWLEGVLVLLDPDELDPDRIAIERRRARLGFVADILESAGRSTEHGSLQEIAERLCGRIGELVVIRQVTEDRRLAIVAAAGCTPLLRHHADAIRTMPPIAAHEGMSGLAFTTGECVVARSTPNYGGTLLEGWRPLVAGANLSWSASIPVRAGGRSVGALVISRVDPRDTFGPEELDELEPLGDWIGTAIAYADLENEAARVKGLLQALLSIHNAAAASSDLRLLAEIVAQQLVTAAGADACAIYVLHDSDSTPLYEAGAGFQTVRSRRGERQQWPHLDRALAGETVHVDDLREESLWDRRRLVEEEGLVGYDAVPIRSASVTYGVVEVFSRTSGGFREPTGFLSGVASMLGGLIRINRLGGAATGPPSPAALIRGGSRLTATELEIVRLVALGLSNVEIGKRVFLSQETIKYHLHRLYRRLGVGNRAELVAIGTKRGWV